MDSIRVDLGEKHVAINDDPSRVITFNPNNLIMAEKFERLYSDFQEKRAEIESRAAEIEKNDTADENGVLLNMQERIDIFRELNEYIRGKIDDIFGAGTSQIVFGDFMSFDFVVYKQFLDGIMPFFQSARGAKVAQYSSKSYQRKGK